MSEMYALLFIYLIPGGYTVSLENHYPSMIECFEAREEVFVNMPGYEDGYPPVNMQGICIRTDTGPINK